MTDPDNSQDLELEPELELQPDDSSARSSPSMAEEGDGVDGQWVWQFAAPPPPPSFLAVFFSGTAHKELYRFFACSVLVVVGCLLPWGPVMVKTAGVDGVVIETMANPTGVMGYETPAGAISLVLGLWLMFSSCYGIYTRRQKILPVFLMLEPAVVALLRTLDAWDKLKSESMLDKVNELFEVAGSGVMLTLIGSGFVAIGFLFLVAKVYTKKDDKGAARRPAREKDAKGAAAAKGSSRKGKIDEPKGGASAVSEAPPVGAEALETLDEVELLDDLGGSVDDSPASSHADDADEASGKSRRSRSRRR